MSVVKSGRRGIAAAMTRAAIQEAARELFVEVGFAATSIDDIARRSESSKGAVYHHFGDKLEIFATVFGQSQERVMQAAIESMGAAGSPWERLEAGTRAFMRAYVADAEARTLLSQAMSVLGWDRVRDIDEATALPLIRAMLDEFIRLGEISPVAVDTAAQVLFSLYCNAVLIIVAAPDAQSVAADVEHLVLALLNGLARPRPTPQPGRQAP
jgi:AcrR family transcriptional regulator